LRYDTRMDAAIGEGGFRAPLRPHEVAHPTLSPDTDPEAERVQLQILRNLPIWRKIQLVLEANEVSRALTLAGLRARHPEAGPEELRRRLFGLELGEELATQVYGPLPEPS
jgi:hypothetical protein